MTEVIYRNGTLAVEIEDTNPVAITRDRGCYVSNWRVGSLPESTRNPAFEAEMLPILAAYAEEAAEELGYLEGDLLIGKGQYRWRS